MDVQRIRSSEEKDEGIARELLKFTTERLPRYRWLFLAEAAADRNPGRRPHGEGQN